MANGGGGGVGGGSRRWSFVGAELTSWGDEMSLAIPARDTGHATPFRGSLLPPPSAPSDVHHTTRHTATGDIEIVFGGGRIKEPTNVFLPRPRKELP